MAVSASNLVNIFFVDIVVHDSVTGIDLAHYEKQSFNCS